MQAWIREHSSIRRRLVLSFLAVVVLMSLGTGVALQELGVMRAQSQHLQGVDLQEASILRVHNDLLTFRETIHAAADARDAAHLEAALAPLRHHFIADLELSTASLSGTPADARRHAVVLIALETLRTSLPAQADSMAELAAVEDWDAVRRRLENQLKSMSQTSERLARDIATEVAIERSDAQARIVKAQRRAIVTLLAIGLLTVLSAAGLGLAVTASIAGPLARLDAGVRALGRVEFEHQVPVTGNDEMTGLAQGFNEMASRLHDLYERVRKSEAHFRSLIENASDLIMVLGAEGTVLYVSPSSARVVGYASEELIGRRALSLTHPEDAPRVSKALAPARPSPGQAEAFRCRFLHKDGSWRLLAGVANSLLEDPAVQGVVVNARDITEDELAAEQIRASLREKELLLREIHHRVKNNLQVISSLLRLQSRHVREPVALDILKDSHDRVRSMALVHETLYQSGDLGRINVAEYVRRLTAHLSSSYGAAPRVVRITIGIEDMEFGIDTAIPCGLLINELVSNSLKHAFPHGRAGEIRVELRREQDGRFLLRVSDDGVGLPEHFDFRDTGSLGLQLVNTLAAQLEGTLELSRDHGTSFELRFRALGNSSPLA